MQSSTPVILADCRRADNPHALLTATDAQRERLAQVRVNADFRFTPASAQAWVENGYPRLG